MPRLSRRTPLRVVLARALVAAAIGGLVAGSSGCGGSSEPATEESAATETQAPADTTPAATEDTSSADTSSSHPAKDFNVNGYDFSVEVSSITFNKDIASPPYTGIEITLTVTNKSDRIADSALLLAYGKVRVPASLGNGSSDCDEQQCEFLLQSHGPIGGTCSKVRATTSACTRWRSRNRRRPRTYTS